MGSKRNKLYLSGRIRIRIRIRISSTVTVVNISRVSCILVYFYYGTVFTIVYDDVYMVFLVPVIESKMTGRSTALIPSHVVCTIRR